MRWASPAPQLFRELVGEQNLPPRFVADLDRFEWDYSTVKLDWALDGPVPWTAPGARDAGTVHLGADLDGMRRYTADLTAGRLPETAFLLFGQMTTSDPTRSPPGTESAWAYTHVPRGLGWDRPAFFADPLIAKLSIMALDAWTFIPFMMILLLAGLQALSREVLEAARVDGANAWQTFWQVTFPLMLPVSVTAIILRIIFKLKLADIIITVTSGGPGGATDSVTSFIFREYRDRSNVGYGTMLAMIYLVLIIVFVTLLLKLANRFVRNVT